jgi:hypothetical protein
MNARNFFAELKRRNVSEVALTSWLEEQNKAARSIGIEVSRSGGFPAAGATWKSPFLDVYLGD